MGNRPHLVGRKEPGVRLIAVSAYPSGPLGSIRWALSRSLGLRPCPLRAMSHSIVRVSPGWRQMVSALEADLGHTLELVSSGSASSEVTSASVGREPCVLLEGEGGSLSMILDWNDIELCGGRVDTFDRILRSKLLMY